LHLIYYIVYLTPFLLCTKIFAGCKTVPVFSTDPENGPTPDDLEKAATAAEADGLRVRILLITNPNNPLGTIYPPDVMKSAIDWARSRNMHTIVDELYALSCHDVSMLLLQFCHFAAQNKLNVETQNQSCR
jgi:aspartate/methionine/tyrosine aminotransferase